jgi:hypothetical protein
MNINGKNKDDDNSKIYILNSMKNINTYINKNEFKKHLDY